MHDDNTQLQILRTQRCPACGQSLPAPACKRCGKPRSQWPAGRAANPTAEYCSRGCRNVHNTLLSRARRGAQPAAR